MEQKEIIEGNKLIAEFMGWKLEQIDKDAIEPEDECWIFQQYNNGEFVSCYLGEEMEVLNRNSTIPFNESWDWLMPVVEKIENGDHIVTLTISGWVCCISGESEEPPYINESANNKIEATWKAIIEFIKWHNQSSPK